MVLGRHTVGWLYRIKKELVHFVVAVDKIFQEHFCCNDNEKHFI